MGDMGHLGNRINVAGLVVRPHAGYKRDVAVESLFVLVKVNASLGVDVELRDLVAAVLLQMVKHPEDGRMLHGGGDDLPLLRVAVDGGVDGGRVRLGRAGGEDNLRVVLGANILGDLVPCLCYSLSRLNCEIVHRGGVAVILGEVGEHRLYDLRINHGGRVVVEVDSSLL